MTSRKQAFKLLKELQPDTIAGYLESIYGYRVEDDHDRRDYNYTFLTFYVLFWRI